MNRCVGGSSFLVIIMILIETVLSRKGGHFSKIVSVGVFPGQNDSELQVSYLISKIVRMSTHS